jgi:cytochrome b561
VFFAQLNNWITLIKKNIISCQTRLFSSLFLFEQCKGDCAFKKKKMDKLLPMAVLSFHFVFGFFVLYLCWIRCNLVFY